MKNWHLDGKLVSNWARIYTWAQQLHKMYQSLQWVDDKENTRGVGLQPFLVAPASSEQGLFPEPLFVSAHG